MGRQFVVIMQGAPGSGKSTLAQHLVGIFGSSPVMFCSTDDYFHLGKEQYEFVAADLGKAHQWNQDRARFLMGTGVTVVIDNTNVRCWEARPYVEMALAFGATVAFVRCEGRFANAHGVPAEKVEAMRAALEPLSVEMCLAARYPWENAAAGERTEDALGLGKEV